MNSQPNDPQQLFLWVMSAATSPNIQRDASQQASIEKTALDPKRDVKFLFIITRLLIALSIGANIDK